jgi:hypothetical protein
MDVRGVDTSIAGLLDEYVVEAAGQALNLGQAAQGTGAVGKRGQGITAPPPGITAARPEPGSGAGARLVGDRVPMCHSATHRLPLSRDIYTRAACSSISSSASGYSGRLWRYYI